MKILFASDVLASQVLTLTVLVTKIDAQWVGDVGLARYEPAVLPHAQP